MTENPQPLKFGKCWCCRQTGKVGPGPAVQANNAEGVPMQVFTQVDLCDFCGHQMAQAFAITALGLVGVVPLLKPAPKSAGVLE